MGSPLGLVLANTFKVELENTVIPPLENKIKMWKRYVDNTICYAKKSSINLMLTTLNSFHNNTKFTIEIQKDSLSDSIYGQLSQQNTKQNIYNSIPTIKKRILIYIFIGILLIKTNGSGEQ